MVRGFFIVCMAKKLLLVRHGEVGEEYLDRYIGSTDISMSPRGREQVKAVRPLLQGNLPDLCISSTMKRCRDTAAILTEGSGIELIFDPDLREIDFGNWEGMTFEEILEDFPDEMDRWIEFSPEFIFPGGERIGDFQARIEVAASRLAANPADTLLLCTHGGVIRMLICHFLGLPFRQYILFKVRHASLTTIELFGESGILSGLNECGGTEKRARWLE